MGVFCVCVSFNTYTYIHSNMFFKRKYWHICVQVFVCVCMMAGLKPFRNNNCKSDNIIYLEPHFQKQSISISHLFHRTQLSPCRPSVPPSLPY